MTETSADWVERPKPADVAALSTRPVPEPEVRREPAVPSSTALPPRLLSGGVAAVLAIAVAGFLRRRRTRR